jgi:hypothetical protein
VIVINCGSSRPTLFFLPTCEIDLEVGREVERHGSKDVCADDSVRVPVVVVGAVLSRAVRVLDGEDVWNAE